VAIADAGRGMAQQQVFEIEAGRSSGLGLRGMRERIRQLGGTFEINSTNKGTVVIARLPLVNERVGKEELGEAQETGLHSPDFAAPPLLSQSPDR
jgi:signal transduction histidine kinase